MSTTAIVLIAVVALLAWCALLDAVKESLALRAKASACPCRDLHSMTLAPGATFELPAGTVLSSGTDADPRVVALAERPRPEAASLRDLVLVSGEDDDGTEDKLGLNCCLLGQPTTLGWLIDDHSECRTKLSELMGFVTGGVLSKPGNDIDDVIGFARAAELHRLVEDYPFIATSNPFLQILEKEIGAEETYRLQTFAEAKGH